MRVFTGDTSKLQPKLHPGLYEEAAWDASAIGDCAQKTRRWAVRGRNLPPPKGGMPAGRICALAVSIV